MAVNNHTRRIVSKLFEASRLLKKVDGIIEGYETKPKPTKLHSNEAEHQQANKSLIYPMQRYLIQTNKHCHRQ